MPRHASSEGTQGGVAPRTLWCGSCNLGWPLLTRSRRGGHAFEDASEVLLGTHTIQKSATPTVECMRLVLEGSEPAVMLQRKHGRDEAGVFSGTHGAIFASEVCIRNTDMVLGIVLPSDPRFPGSYLERTQNVPGPYLERTWRVPRRYLQRTWSVLGVHPHSTGHPLSIQCPRVDTRKLVA